MIVRCLMRRPIMIRLDNSTSGRTQHHSGSSSLTVAKLWEERTCGEAIAVSALSWTRVFNLNATPTRHLWGSGAAEKDLRNIWGKEWSLLTQNYTRNLCEDWLTTRSNSALKRTRARWQALICPCPERMNERPEYFCDSVKWFSNLVSLGSKKL